MQVDLCLISIPTKADLFFFSLYLNHPELDPLIPPFSSIRDVIYYITPKKRIRTRHLTVIDQLSKHGHFKNNYLLKKLTLLYIHHGNPKCLFSFYTPFYNSLQHLQFHKRPQTIVTTLHQMGRLPVCHKTIIKNIYLLLNFHSCVFNLIQIVL